MSNRGFLIYAEGPEYIKQAYLCALSIIKNKNTYPVSIVTNSDVSLYKHVFDKVITLPYVQEDDSSFKTEGRKYLYEVSPYKETIVLDSDVLVLENLDYLWNLMTRDVYYPDTAFTYRGEKITIFLIVIMPSFSLEKEILQISFTMYKKMLHRNGKNFMTFGVRNMYLHSRVWI